MPLLADVCKQLGVSIIGKQEGADGEWLVFIGYETSFPDPPRQLHILYSDTHDCIDISEEEKDAMKRRFSSEPPSGSVGSPFKTTE